MLLAVTMTRELRLETRHSYYWCILLTSPFSHASYFEFLFVGFGDKVLDIRAFMKAKTTTQVFNTLVDFVLSHLRFGSCPTNQATT